MYSFANARKNMVECQIMPSNVKDKRIVDAMLRIPRERFVNKQDQAHAYLDEDICIGYGRYLEEPVILARMIEAANLKADDLVLDIGAGTGYSSAIISDIVATVVSVEKGKKFVGQAEEILKDLDICNVAVMQSELIDGYAEQAPYDVIFIHGAINEIPEVILEQLADNGRLVAVISNEGNINKNTGIGRMVLAEKTSNGIAFTDKFDLSTPILAGFSANDKFVF